jgi:ABC-type dipeptide/oligopeptide/nickel transport system ATPase component|tara:strand:+ start:358 stop:1056 length:699 start_codon:yes stop_codon:yes gene_type:complete
VTVLYVHELTVNSGTGDALREISFHLDAGEILGLIGGAKAGKTALCRALVGLLEPPSRISDGKIFFENRDLAALDSTALAEVRNRGLTVIEEASADDLAAARTAAPRILAVASEVPAESLQQLMRLRDDAGTAIILAAREGRTIVPACDAIAVLCGGRLVERAPRDTWLTASRHPYSQALQADPAPDGAAAITGCPYRGPCPRVGAGCETADMRLQLVEPDHSTACVRWRDF